MLVTRNFTFRAYPYHEHLEAWLRQFAGTRHAYNLAVRECRDEDARNQERKDAGLPPEYTLSASTFDFAWVGERKHTALTDRKGTEYRPLEEMPFFSAVSAAAKRAALAYKAVLRKRSAGQAAELQFKSWRADQSCTWQTQCSPARKTPKPDEERYAVQLRPDGTAKLRAKDDSQGRWRKGDPFIKDTGAFNWKAFPEDLITLTSLSSGDRAWAALKVPGKLGSTLRIRMHRQLPAGSRVDSITVKYCRSDGTWWATLNVTFDSKHLKPSAADGIVGIDPGNTHLAYCSRSVGDRTELSPPCGKGVARDAERRVALERRVSEIRLRYCHCLNDEGRLIKGCRKEGHSAWRDDTEYNRLRRLLGKIRRREADRYKDAIRKFARQVASNYKYAALGTGGHLNTARRARAPEDREEGRNYGVAAHTVANRRNRESRWGAMKLCLQSAGATVLDVDERHTSRTCSSCSYRHSEEEYKTARPGGGTRWKCVKCGYRDHADHNAAINIERRGAALITR